MKDVKKNYIGEWRSSRPERGIWELFVFYAQFLCKNNIFCKKKWPQVIIVRGIYADTETC